jgi:Fic family protein
MLELPNNLAKRRDLETFELASFVARNPGVAYSKIEQGAGAISATCRTSFYNHLKRAIDYGWLRRTGATKNSQYYATEQFGHHLALRELAKPAIKRSKVGYSEAFLDKYQPNQSFFLTQAQRDSLHAQCPEGSFIAADEKVSRQMRRFMADITHNSSAFEGVNVRYADTIEFLEQHIESRNMSPNEAVILRNHYNAIRCIVEGIHHPSQENDIQLREFEIRSIHSIASAGLFADPTKQGTLRSGAVEIRDSAYIPTAQPDIVCRDFRKLAIKAAQINDPYEQSLFLLVFIPYLQPFSDCNKRLSRLVCNIPLLAKGCIPVSWAEVNQRDYTDSLMCVYEHNSTYGIAEVFTDACSRSIERMVLHDGMRTPSRMEISHAQQIAVAVRSRILEGDTSTPPGVAEHERNEFTQIVESTLDVIRVNEMASAPFRLPMQDVRRWIQSELAGQGTTEQGADPALVSTEGDFDK